MQMTHSHRQPIAALQEAVGVASIKHSVWVISAWQEDSVECGAAPEHIKLCENYKLTPKELMQREYVGW